MVRGTRSGGDGVPERWNIGSWMGEGNGRGLILGAVRGWEW